MRTCGGTWVAHGSGDADREVVDRHDRVSVPPDRPAYHLRRVWLTPEEEQAYYYGFSNQALWPLCHVAYTRPRFDRHHWQAYQAVNRRFADAVLEEVGDDPAWVFIQDYHFALLPRMIKQARPDLFLAHFWHIPWPNPEIFAVCPWAEEIVEGLLGNDLLGFHIPFHCNNFLGTVKRTVEAIVDHDDGVAVRQGRRTTVRAYPISVDIGSISAQASSCERASRVAELRAELGLDEQMIGVGVDRVDYTKGIRERLWAIDRFFEKYPRYQRGFTFLQVGPESRVDITEYAELNEEIDQISGEINARYGCDGWLPIRVLKGNYPHSDLISLFLMSDLCIVSSLHDGMNLVAKEFVSARPDGNGVLLLSRFTGAARELDGALQINPYDTEAFADAICQALEMPHEERRRRIDSMRTVVGENNIYDWAANVVTDIRRLAALG
jgi:trehalose-6-phosphate synthase